MVDLIKFDEVVTLICDCAVTNSRILAIDDDDYDDENNLDCNYIKVLKNFTKDLME